MQNCTRTRNRVNMFTSPVHAPLPAMGKLLLCALTLLVILAKCHSEDKLHCFQCTVTGKSKQVQESVIVSQLCSKFDESEDYVVECPYSTMCLKTITTLHLQNGQKQETITRGCAQQKNTTQVFQNRQWQPKHMVQEVYQEGCTEVKGNNLVGSTNTHCYCRGDLCNAAANLLRIGPAHCYAVILLFITRCLLL